MVLELFNFKTVMDERYNEYVILENSAIKNIVNIQDKTEFEALENHVHLFRNVKKHEFDELVSLADRLGKVLLSALKHNFPNKYFYVYITIKVQGSFIIRFHQKWENEAPYYNVSDLDKGKEKILAFEG